MTSSGREGDVIGIERQGGWCDWHLLIGRAMCLASSGREGEVFGIYSCTDREGDASTLV